MYMKNIMVGCETCILNRVSMCMHTTLLYSNTRLAPMMTSRQRRYTILYGGQSVWCTVPSACTSCASHVMLTFCLQGKKGKKGGKKGKGKKVFGADSCILLLDRIAVI